MFVTGYAVTLTILRCVNTFKQTLAQISVKFTLSFVCNRSGSRTGGPNGVNSSENAVTTFLQSTAWGILAIWRAFVGDLNLIASSRTSITTPTSGHAHGSKWQHFTSPRFQAQSHHHRQRPVPKGLARPSPPARQCWARRRSKTKLTIWKFGTTQVCCR